MEERDSVDFKALGAKFREKRLQLGLTQEKVAERIGIDDGSYSRIERGVFQVGVETLVKIADLYDLSLDYLLLDSTQRSSDEKLLTELDNIFRDKTPAETKFLLNLLKVQADNIKKIKS